MNNERRWGHQAKLSATLLLLTVACSTSQTKPAASPSLVSAGKASQSAPVGELEEMRSATTRPGRFRDAFESLRDSIDVTLSQPISVPEPKDPGGGYTHERHKRNYREMYEAGLLYRLTGDSKYAAHVGQMLLAYAQLYPTLPVHPEKRNRNKGKLFWQGLNEAVWLVHTIQAYEACRDAISKEDRLRIEEGVLRPMTRFLSVESPETFDRIHNHATWATAAVGMSGYVLGEEKWVKQALLGLDESGKKGFLRQLEELFSPDGYYNEGPYYQRYALLPFVTFASVIDRHEPKRKIFEHHSGVLLKAIRTTIELSYNGLFFPLNDAIKSKGIDTNELVVGVSIAYSRTQDPRLLDIAEQQDRVLLTPAGYRLVRDTEKGLARPYPFESQVYSDGSKGNRGALVVMREPSRSGSFNQGPSIVFKATSQGGGHGHFDKLGWQFYDLGSEIVSDYGAARFLNVAAKDGGRYLPENTSWAKQTVAHNALVVDGRSHFDADAKLAEKSHPKLLFFKRNAGATVASAVMTGAYPDTTFTRTMALVELDKRLPQVVFDLVHVHSEELHQYDLPVHYQGQLMGTNFPVRASVERLSPAGKDHGYEHLWQKARAPLQTPLSQLTWLNKNGRFYTYGILAEAGDEVLLTELGAQDPNFNLRRERAFIFRSTSRAQRSFVSVLEPHGEYNPSDEYTLSSQSQIKELSHARSATAEIVAVTLDNGSRVALAICTKPQCPKSETLRVDLGTKSYEFEGRFKVIREGANASN